MRVKTIAMPCSSAAATTSSSRTEPPGSITALTPASAAASMPSRNGKNASDASTEAADLEPLVQRLDARDLRGVDPAHLARPDPDGHAVPAVDDGVRLHELDDLPREEQIPHFRLVGRAPGHDLQIIPGDGAGIAVLHQQPAGDPLEVERGVRRGGERATLQHPDVLLARERRERPGFDAGRDDDLDELAFDDRRGGLRIERAVERDDAAERGRRIGSERAIVRIANAFPDRDTARVRMLDDHAGGLFEALHTFEGGVRIGHVVE